MMVKVPGIYYVSVMFGVTKKAWYLHLRKNGVYIASVQKDYNAGYEDSLNLHAIGPVLPKLQALHATTVSILALQIKNRSKLMPKKVIQSMFSARIPTSNSEPTTTLPNFLDF